MEEIEFNVVEPSSFQSKEEHHQIPSLDIARDDESVANLINAATEDDTPNEGKESSVGVALTDQENKENVEQETVTSAHVPGPLESVFQHHVVTEITTEKILPKIKKIR